MQGLCPAWNLTNHWRLIDEFGMNEMTTCGLDQTEYGGFLLGMDCATPANIVAG
jgi:hypothetical protein